MRLLLDTHVWLWTHLAPDRLSARSRHLLEDAEHELWLSPISLWEVHLLAERQRLDLPPSPGHWIAQRLAEQPLRDALVNREIALRSRQLPMQKGDPADRFIVATAVVGDLVLMTADAELLRFAGCRTVDAGRGSAA